MLRFRSVLAALFACVLLIAGCGGSTAHKVRVGSAQPVQLHGGRTHAPDFGTPPAGDFGLGLQPHNLTATALLEGYDAVTLANVPSSTQVAGCYVDGRFANCTEARSRFPHAKLVTIAVSASYRGPAKILDTEPGDAIPSQDAGFIETQIRVYHTFRPGVYADAAEMPLVQEELRAAGLARSQYTLWLADWDGNPAIPSGYDAKQWFSNQSIDRDSFLSTFFAPPPKPPAPKPKPVKWASAEIQCPKLTWKGGHFDEVNGHWTISPGCRIHSMPFGASPLGAK